jgi:cation diffusion facilitator CzcD-associated flavoprotein CzcO
MAAPLEAQRTRRSARVAVVGAGAAGLAAARELRAEGHAVTVYEAGAAAGGTWRYDAASGHSSMYDSLRTNLPRELMAFSDFPFDASAPLAGDARRYCGHAEVLAYLTAFADAHALHDSIRFGVRVLRARPLWASATPAGPQWEVTTSGSDAASSTSVFDALVVANGHYSAPRTPEVDGLPHFRGVVAHTHDYRTPEPYAGKRVVVVGAAASGEDISRDIAPVAAATFLSAASFQTDGPLAGGAVQKRAMLVRLGADGVAEFADGAREHDVDAVLFATGYHFSFPFLGACASRG